MAIVAAQEPQVSNGEIVVGGIRQQLKTMEASLVRESVHVVKVKDQYGDFVPRLSKTGGYLLNARFARVFDKENDCVRTDLTGQDVFVIDRETGEYKCTSQGKPITRNGIHCVETTIEIPKQLFHSVVEGQEVSLEQRCFAWLYNNGFDEETITTELALKQAFEFIIEDMQNELGLVEVYYTDRSYVAPRNANGGVFWICGLTPELLEEQLTGFYRQDKSIAEQGTLPTHVHNVHLWERTKANRAASRGENQGRQASHNLLTDFLKPKDAARLVKSLV